MQTGVAKFGMLIALCIASYSKNGVAVAGISKIVPSAVCHGAVDRAKLRDLISQDANLLPKLEAIIHPLVKADREGFIAKNPEINFSF